VKILVDHGAEIIHTSEELKEFSPLFYAIEMDNPYIIELFCDTDISLDTVNSEGHTPLMFAAYNGHNETVNHLTFRTKNLDTEDQKGNTLILLYVDKEDVEMVNKLLSRGADVNYRNRFGKSPLLKAVENNCLPELVDLLLRKGANAHL